MMYTQKQFGKELKEKIYQKQHVSDIGRWTNSVYYEHINEINSSLEDILLTLNTMEDGPEFYFTYEELDKIADDLIAGKEVKL